ncbi:Crp/Fnr family transcriptional regulator [Salisaeta longa]|uniref:Crp/Fnr family transcriptional regulator n=1 Tax=Salisaeta longa TaxID=503170 RepID=UPI0003B3421B|nr:cyclic nucleotide-binding domain-containing protein [Salisaeta longa]
MPSLVGRLRRLYRRLTASSSTNEWQPIMDALHAVGPFHDCSLRTLRHVAQMGHPRRYRRGEALYYEGDPGLGLYVVQEGRVRLSAEDEPGHVQELAQVGPATLLGGASLVGDFRRMETAEAVTEAVVFGFFKPDLKGLMRRHPTAAAEFLRALAAWGTAQHVALVEQFAAQEGAGAALRVYIDAMQRASTSNE